MTNHPEQFEQVKEGRKTLHAATTEVGHEGPKARERAEMESPAPPAAPLPFKSREAVAARH